MSMGIAADALAQVRRARIEPTWRAWDANGRLERLVFRLCVRLHGAVPVRTSVDDLAQDVRLRVEQTLHQCVPRAPIGAWITVIATNVIREHLRQERRLPAHPDGNFELVEEEVEGTCFLTVEQMLYIDVVFSSPEAKLLFLRNLIENERESSLTGAEKKREQRARKQLREDEGRDSS